MARHVLVPYDDSEPAQSALEHALEEFPDAMVTVLAVADQSEMHPVPAGTGEASPGEEIAAVAEERVESARSIADDRKARFRAELRGGAPANEIVDYVEGSDVDHVVIGSEGRSGISRVLLGSVAESVVRHSPVPVTVVE